MDHRADAGKERGLSEYSFDYCFPGDEFGYKLTALIGRERKTGCHGDGHPNKRVNGKIYD